MSGTVTIGAYTKDVYDGRTGTDEYLLTSARWEESWQTAVTAADSSAERAMVDATRVLNAQQWQGTKTSDGQPLAWPRDGVDGVTDGTTPDAIVEAFYILSAMAVEDPEALQSFATASIKSAQAGTARVEFFSPQSTERFDLTVMELIAPYLLGSAAGAEGVGIGESFGTDGELIDDEDAFGLNGGI